MSHSLAKKFDKIVSKLGSKHKEQKGNGSEPSDHHAHVDEGGTSNDGNVDPVHESILQRMIGHLGHGSAKGDHHQQHVEGAPPLHIIVDDLKDSSFKGK